MPVLIDQEQIVRSLCLRTVVKYLSTMIHYSDRHSERQRARRREFLKIEYAGRLISCLVRKYDRVRKMEAVSRYNVL